MNKTVNINLGGQFFHIDEDAYQNLNSYFEAIKRYLSNSEGKDEIMSDIEYRVAELFSQKLKSDRQVITNADLDEVISIMGKPEDYRIEEEFSSSNTYTETIKTVKNRKLYRDADRRFLGGVLAGFSHYFGIDVVWLRIILLVLFFFYGFGGLIYLILWAVIPKAKTTSEKLEMKGEPVTISNIEKKVREQADLISKKLNEVDYDKFGNKVKSTKDSIFNSLGKFTETIIEIIGKVIGLIAILISVVSLGAILVATFTVGTTNITQSKWINLPDIFFYSDFPYWLLLSLIFVSVAVPFIFLLLLGFKMLVPNMKSFGKIGYISLLVVWIIAVISLIVMSFKQATEYAYDQKVVLKENLDFIKSDTITLQLDYNPNFSNGLSDTSKFKLKLDENDNEIIFSNDVFIDIKKTKETFPFIQLEKSAEGNSLKDATTRANNINYSFKVEGNTIVLNNFLTTDFKQKLRGQEVKVVLFVPENYVLRIDESLTYATSSFSSDVLVRSLVNNRLYKYEGEEFKCIDCDDLVDETTETTTVETDSTSTSKSVKVNINLL